MSTSSTDDAMTKDPLADITIYVHVIDHGYSLQAMDVDMLVFDISPSGNGLIATLGPSAAIITGTDTGLIRVGFRVLSRRPPIDRKRWRQQGWGSIAEASLEVASGAIAVGSEGLFEARLTSDLLTGDGDYRLRVYAAGRDEASNEPIGAPTNEHHIIELWLEPASEPTLLLGDDQYGELWGRRGMNLAGPNPDLSRRRS